MLRPDPYRPARPSTQFGAKLKELMAGRNGASLPGGRVSGAVRVAAIHGAAQVVAAHLGAGSKLSARQVLELVEGVRARLEGAGIKDA